MQYKPNIANFFALSIHDDWKPGSSNQKWINIEIKKTYLCHYLTTELCKITKKNILDIF